MSDFLDKAKGWHEVKGRELDMLKDVFKAHDILTIKELEKRDADYMKARFGISWGNANFVELGIWNVIKEQCIAESQLECAGKCYYCWE
jgi:hypothetical protein